MSPYTAPVWNKGRGGRCYITPLYVPANLDEAICKRMLQDSLGILVWVSIIQLVLGSSESAIHSSLLSCSHYHGLYYVALLGMVVISVLIQVPVATSTQTKLVQYIQLVMYSRIPYLNIDWNSRAIHGSFLSLPSPLMLSVIRGCL